MAAHSSERERAAMKCEREVNSLYACLLMEDRVGEEFAATVSSITDFGLFVELDTEHVEGLVRADDLGPGHKLVVGALTWPTGRRVQVGQALTVRLAGVNVQRRQMDFDVVAFAGEQPLARRTAAERLESAAARTGAHPGSLGSRPPGTPVDDGRASSSRARRPRTRSERGRASGARARAAEDCARGAGDRVRREIARSRAGPGRRGKGPSGDGRSRRARAAGSTPRPRSLG